MQAKTTKKIVLRMQCSECKAQCMKPIKVRVQSVSGGTHKHAHRDGLGRVAGVGCNKQRMHKK